MGLGWGVGYQIVFALTDINLKFAQILYWGIFIFSWLGAKIFFYLNSAQENSEALLGQVSFWTGGGFVFYGGLIFALLFLLIYKILRFPLTPQTLWSMLVALTLGHAIGRVGCLLAGCCYGSVTDWWWGIELHGAHRHPTQLLESLGLLAIGLYVYKWRASLKAFALYFVGYGLLRFGVETLRGDKIRGQWGAFTPSQWISLGLILGGGMIIIKLHKFKALSDSKQKKSSFFEQ